MRPANPAPGPSLLLNWARSDRIYKLYQVVVNLLVCPRATPFLWLVFCISSGRSVLKYLHRYYGINLNGYHFESSSHEHFLDLGSISGTLCIRGDEFDFPRFVDTQAQLNSSFYLVLLEDLPAGNFRCAAVEAQ